MSIICAYKDKYDTKHSKTNVAMCIITGTGRYIATQEKRWNKDGSRAASVWGFPGGKVEPGETHIGAGIREFDEEVYHVEKGQNREFSIRSVIHIFAFLFTIIVDTNDASTITYVYYAGNFRFPKFIPQPSEITAVMYPRISALFESVKTQKITCEGETLSLRRCLFDMLNEIEVFEVLVRFHLAKFGVSC